MSDATDHVMWDVWVEDEAINQVGVKDKTMTCDSP